MSNLKELLTSNDALEIIDGLKSPQILSDSSLWHVVKPLVVHTDRMVRDEAVKTMNSILEALSCKNKSVAGPVLMEFLETVQDEGIKVRIIALLAQMGVTESVDAIEKYATSRNSDMAVPAIQAFGVLATPRCIHFLIDLMSLEAPLLRNAACDALVNAGPKALDGLVCLLENNDNDLVILSSNVLGNMGLPEAIPQLADLFYHQDANVRYAAIEAVGKIGSKRAIVKLAATLCDTDEQVKIATIHAFQDIGDCAAVPAILDHVNDSENVRQAIARSLLEMGCFEHLEDVLKSDDFRDAVRNYIHEHRRAVSIQDWKGRFSSIQNEYVRTTLEECAEKASAVVSKSGRVLVADDSKAMRSYVQNILKESFEITLAEDGIEAFNFFRSGVWDLILTDMNMPRMDGITLVRRIRSQDNSVPIIMVTTESEQSDMNMGFSSGVNSYLTKPFNPEQLIMVVKTFLPDAAIDDGCGMEDLFFGSIDDDDDDE
ncbi:MAG: hypothetical protein CVV64_07385 [Candidatus Wallbacteria bacterium HGW-Wallbacteria-1]|uniref:Response regulatory domain-containing protein n=1 Tax=Candidatus Wallbacteria bacterium HGW-Wallbacteria-1 TaxID=2013854 RepID=A0A2N1PQS6_9BACT|nr:MAG: hypothetical protein CVV64_07385 [Candidatus Wallbacteria bacterium HGW-Wallbacteria-1]